MSTTNDSAPITAKNPGWPNFSAMPFKFIPVKTKHKTHVLPVPGGVFFAGKAEAIRSMHDETREGETKGQCKKRKWKKP
jgi:hypothetical protein